MCYVSLYYLCFYCSGDNTFRPRCRQTVISMIFFLWLSLSVQLKIYTFMSFVSSFNVFIGLPFSFLLCIFSSTSNLPAHFLASSFFYIIIPFRISFIFLLFIIHDFTFSFPRSTKSQPVLCFTNS